MDYLNRLVVIAGLGTCGALFSFQSAEKLQRLDVADSMRQLDLMADSGEVRARLMEQHHRRSHWRLGWGVVLIGAALGFMFESIIAVARRCGLIGLVLLLVTSSGCWRPFEPVKLEVIQPNEEAFLLPFTESVDKQQSTHTEEYLRRNLVHTQQVKIPQQWVPKGYETVFSNGQWRDAAILVRVDKSPVTREWTADPNSGTSTKNEAIWVMTSDQVEFSTGWTCTARIASRDDAVKFLHNYPNGALTQVMDQEIRAKLQSSFGIEVTDLPMEELRLKATPHIQSVVAGVTEFFSERGITITNLGISGGFVYKDPSIIKMLVEVFNAEQKKAIAMAETSAQIEKNKTIQLEADSRAKALLTEREAEAEGIRLVADAKGYEIEKAAEDSQVYLDLKRIELEKAKLEKWDGRFPTYFMGGANGSLDMLLQAPAIAEHRAESLK